MYVRVVLCLHDNPPWGGYCSTFVNVDCVILFTHGSCKGIGHLRMRITFASDAVIISIREGTVESWNFAAVTYYLWKSIILA